MDLTRRSLAKLLGLAAVQPAAVVGPAAEIMAAAAPAVAALAPVPARGWVTEKILLSLASGLKNDNHFFWATSFNNPAWNDSKPVLGSEQLRATMEGPASPDAFSTLADIAIILEPFKALTLSQMQDALFIGEVIQELHPHRENPEKPAQGYAGTAKLFSSYFDAGKPVSEIIAAVNEKRVVFGLELTGRLDAALKNAQREIPEWIYTLERDLPNIRDPRISTIIEKSRAAVVRDCALREKRDRRRKATRKAAARRKVGKNLAEYEFERLDRTPLLQLAEPDLPGFVRVYKVSSQKKTLTAAMVNNTLRDEKRLALTRFDMKRAAALTGLRQGVDYRLRVLDEKNILIIAMNWRLLACLDQCAGTSALVLKTPVVDDSATLLQRRHRLWQGRTAWNDAPKPV